jgi:hypothetical protein
MKRSTIFRSSIAVLLAGILAFDAGCYGSMRLTKKLYKWNGTVGDKWANSAVAWVITIIPVYQVCVFIDVVVFNTIEFYTGKNPLAFSGSKETQKTVQSKGKTYNVVLGNNKVIISETAGPDAGKTVSIVYNAENGTWVLDGAGKSVVVASFNPSPAGSLSLYGANGAVTMRQLAMAQ